MSVKVEYIEVDAARMDIVVCRKASELYEGGERVYVLACSAAHADLIDSMLWTFEDQSFVPHSLFGGSDKPGDPVVVGAEAGVNPNGGEVLLIAGDCPVDGMVRSASLFARVIDFVPTAEGKDKNAARERYRAFGKAGFSPLFRPLAR